MATINLGRVKGDPFTYDDFTPEQLAGLKGESFKFEDFSEEQLDSITPKIEVGTVTTLDAGSQATVTPTVNGNTTTFDFGIPKGQDFNLEKIDTKTDLMANTEVGKLADALAIKEAITEVDKPDIANYTDLMANSVAGYNADALAIKGGFQDIKNNLVKYNSDIHIVSDLLEEAEKGADSIFIVEYSENTANTPYTAGLTGDYKAGMALILMTGKNYGQIVAFTAGTDQIFSRHKKNTGWGNWKEVNPHENNAGSHNCIYRGRNLGESVTEIQYANIAAGTFDNLYIGDYWKINNVNYRIAAFDYYYNTGDTSCTAHHVVVVPDKPLYNHVMNDTNVVTGAYVGSKMYTEGLNRAKEMINTAFGSEHILNHKQFLYTTVNSGGFTTTGEWLNSTVELMNERNVFGNAVFSNQVNGTLVAGNHTVDKSQYPLFFYRPDMISNRAGFWLRDVASSERFACVNSDGNAGSGPSSTATAGVRPAFCIC